MSELDEIFHKFGLEVNRAYDRTAVISMTARVGSTAFVSALTSCGLSGRPIREIFNPRSSMKDLSEKFKPSSLVDYLNQYYGQETSGVLAFKTNWIDFATVVNWTGNHFREIFPEVKFVHIERKDKVAQAYSLWKANEYNIWHREAGAKYESPVVGQVPLGPIKNNLANLQAEETKWQQYFEMNEIVPHRVYFEDFSENLTDAVSGAFQYFTGEMPEKKPVSSLVRSSDERDTMVLFDLHSRLTDEAMSNDDETRR